MTPGAPHVALSLGELAGTLDAAAGVRSFKGIRYAQAPVGELRWRPPVPAPAWSGTFDATAFGADSPQNSQNLSRAPGQNEDCLFLNVWAPEGAAPGSLPVMVWLHGGSFVGGTGADARVDGTSLARKGAVVVTLNYRVGLFGFLAHAGLTAESPHHASGNYGLLDQVCALRWVKDHIHAFGGDANNVTVFGVSAGSASISLLLASPLAAGLFDKAILQSPGAARPLASLADAEAAGATLGNDIAALRALPADELLKRTSLLVPKTRGLTTPRVLRPIRDGSVLPEDERPVLKAGRVHAMPMIVGSNADEGSLLTAAWPVDSLAAYDTLLRDNFPGTESHAREHYPAGADAQVRPQVAAIFADTQFNYGTRLLAETYARLRPGATWRYLFTRRRPSQADGPHHGEEVGHVFGNLSAARAGSPAAFDATDEALSAYMMDAWVAFARTGNPNGGHGTPWPAYDAGHDPYLELGDAVRPGAGWRRAQLDFLEDLYESRARG